MASVNKVILVGNLGRDPETRYMPSGDAICNISVATKETWKDKQSGEKKEATEWHRVVFFGRQAEVAGQYLKKGSQVYIEGRLQTKKYQKDGVDHYSTEIRADVMQFLGGREGSGDAPARDQNRDQAREPAPSRGGYDSAPPFPPQTQSAAPQSSPSRGGGNFNDMDDDIPF